MMPRPRAFVINEPLKRDPETGQMVSLMDFTPARDFGDLHFLLPAGRALPNDPAMVVSSLHDGLADFTQADYIVAVGNPAVLGAAVGIAALYAEGHVNILVWDKRRNAYELWPFRLWTPEHVDSPS